MSLTIEEHELLWLFEVEPKKAHEHEYWFLTTSVYRVEKGDLTLSFSIHPHYKDIGIVLLKDDQKILDISATSVNAVTAKKVDKGETLTGEILEIEVDDNQKILLQVKPEIAIHQEICATS